MERALGATASGERASIFGQIFSSDLIIPCRHDLKSANKTTVHYRSRPIWLKNLSDHGCYARMSAPQFVRLPHSLKRLLGMEAELPLLQARDLAIALSALLDTVILL